MPGLAWLEAALTLSSSALYTWDMADKGAKQRFLEFLAQRRFRLTAQRRAIIDTVFDTRAHFTAEELLAWSRRRDKSVSRATVYRTVPLLTESGLVAEMDLGGTHKLYDPNYADHPHHNHIVCLDCGRIIEFEDDQLHKLQHDLAREMGFSIASHRLQITAHCEEYQRCGTCRKREC